jgi:hypothetical protein
MKVSEIMIGDFVSITEPDDFHGYVGKVVNINGETGYVTVHISDMHTHDVLCDDLQPIPLTKEILLKNGFEDFAGGGCIIKETIEDEEPIYIWNGNGSIYVVDYCSLNKYTYIKEIQLVNISSIVSKLLAFKLFKLMIVKL